MVYPLSLNENLLSGDRARNHYRDFRKPSVTIQASLPNKVQDLLPRGFSGSFLVAVPQQMDLKMREMRRATTGEASKQASVLQSKGATNNTIVVKGFGTAKIEPPNPSFDEHRLNMWPPVLNNAYDHAAQKRQGSTSSPKIDHQDSLDGAAYVKESTRDQRGTHTFAPTLERLVEQAPGNARCNASIGVQLASVINFNITPFDHEDDDDLIFPFDHFDEDEQRRGFARAIDDAINAGRNPFSNCRVCGEDHIISSGPPITLAQRDTCGSMLPDWFPKDQFEKPWDSFMHMFNDMARLTELQNGWREDPQFVNLWDKEFHDKNQPEWAAVGRKKGGWWKCRNLGRHTRQVERRCFECHGPEGRAATAELMATIKERNEEISTDRKRDLMDAWIAKALERELENDKRIVIGRERARLRNENEAKSSGEASMGKYAISSMSL